MHSPEEHADAILRRLRKIQIPHQQFPIERPAFAPEWCAEQIAVRLVARRHEALQMLSDGFCARDAKGKKLLPASVPIKTEVKICDPLRTQ